jgi:hypothetical protein
MQDTKSCIRVPELGQGGRVQRTRTCGTEGAVGERVREREWEPESEQLEWSELVPVGGKVIGEQAEAEVNYT